MRRAFTLIELAVVVAVFMVLASIAIPVYADAQLRSRQAEVYTIVDGLATAQVAHTVTYDEPWFTAGFQPDASPGRTVRPWSGIDEVGFAPDGGVRGSYTLAEPGIGTYCFPTPLSSLACPAGEPYCVSGMSDLDANNARCCIWASETVGLTPMCPAPYQY